MPILRDLIVQINKLVGTILFDLTGESEDHFLWLYDGHVASTLAALEGAELRIVAGIVVCLRPVDAICHVSL